MTKKDKIAEAMRQKKVLEARLAAMEKAKHPYRTGVGMLIESELEKASIVLAAQGIVDKLGKMAEDLAKVEGDDIMPMMDSLKTAFGPQMAEEFQKMAGAQVRAAVQALSGSKDALATQVSKLEGVVNGEPVSDMASYEEPEADPMAAPARRATSVAGASSARA
jgi:hypothetical protein